MNNNMEEQVLKVFNKINTGEIRYTVVGDVTRGLKDLKLGDVKQFTYTNGLSCLGVVVGKIPNQYRILKITGEEVQVQVTPKEVNIIAGYQSVRLPKEIRSIFNKLSDSLDETIQYLYYIGIIADLVNGIIVIKGISKNYDRGILSIKLPKDKKYKGVLIKERAFICLKNLTEVDLSGIQLPLKIGKEAFWYLTKLKKVILPKTLVTIYEGAFLGCSIGSINLEDCDSLDAIHEDAFCGNIFNSNTVLKFPKNLSYIGEEAFSGVNEWDKTIHIKELDFSLCKKLEDIGENTFVYLTIHKKVILPKCIKSLNADAFYGCELRQGIDRVGNHTFKVV